MSVRTKRRAMWVSALAVGVALLAACGVDAIGDALAPAPGPDAEAGLPSLPESGVVDGGADAFDPDASETSIAVGCAACAGAGGTCKPNDAGVTACFYDCSTKGGCPNVVCPPGIACDITCNEEGSCDKVDCSGASSCRIICKANQACHDVTCAGASCLVRCEGEGACATAVACRAGACDIGCKGATACGVVRCTSPTCNLQCESENACQQVTTAGGTSTIHCHDKTCGALVCSGAVCNLQCDGANSCQSRCCDAGACNQDALEAGASPTFCIP